MQHFPHRILCLNAGSPDGGAVLGGVEPLWLWSSYWKWDTVGRFWRWYPVVNLDHVSYGREGLLEINPPVYGTVLEIRAECAKSCFSSWFTSDSLGREDTGISHVASDPVSTKLEVPALKRPGCQYMKAGIIFCLVPQNLAFLCFRLQVSDCSFLSGTMAMMLGCGHLNEMSPIFLILTSWWHSLWRFRSYAFLAGGSQPVGSDFEVSKATCHSRFTLMDKWKLYLSIIPIPQTHTLVSPSV